MYVRHLALALVVMVLLTTISTTGDVTSFSEDADADNSSETVGSLEEAFSLYPDEWTNGITSPRTGSSESDYLGTLLLLPQESPLPVDDFTDEDTVELQLNGDRTSTSSSFYIPQSQELFRSTLTRFGLVSSPTDTYQIPGPTTTEQSRFRSYRFRPHFVNTAKGLRNIPAQLNDGQLVHAPDDVTERPSSSSSSSTASRRPAGESTTVGRPSQGTTPSSTITSLFNSFKRKIKAIYPGTVWCGDGNQAKSEDDIGFFYLTDSCCRAHDLCPITIAAGEQFNRLRNNGHFTRSHCDCDKQFYNCLKNADTLVSRQIGYTYFNLLKPQCFRYEHPKVSCTKRKKGKCLTYVVNEQQSKQWQWFDNLIF
ncbi:uncharacterized protein LOC125954227 isoform X2 [Anopheles darlingi]|uniref:uncharacterized protein LOC125954227 isoform X2 n=1 Tax=Anopheles darlingi TaxID=43151 RepID=UPI0020FFFE4D|nr:uncharacterized protein LOC125954227 isoform X2 [Anopheles darlingi]